MWARNSGPGNSTTRKVISALQASLPSQRISACVTAKPEPSCSSLADSDSCLSGRDEGAELGFLERGEERHAGELGGGDDQPAGGLRHRLDQKHAGHQRIAREVSLEDGRRGGNTRLSADRFRAEIEIDDAVDQLEVFKAHACASGALGGDQFVDAVAQVLQLKILVGRGLAVVDLLRPLLERHLDPERLVDREGDIEEVQAVDPQIVDRVTLRLDRVARDVAGLGDDIGHGVKGRRHS